MASSIKTALLNIPVATDTDLMLRFVTSIKYTANVARMVNNVTFLQDPNWEMTANDSTTLPLAFFFVKKWTEEYTSEVNQKPMLFYNSNADNKDATKGTLLDIVADNVVVKPKTYKMDVLVPFTPDACLNQYQMDNDTLMSTVSFATQGKEGELIDKFGFSVYNRVVSNSIGIMRLIFSALGVDLNFASISSALLEQDDINKRSLEAMRDNRGVVKLKMWNGWKFKYLIITSLDLSKSGEIEGFYEGTITMQELPVITIASGNRVFTSEGKSFLYKRFAKAKVAYLNGLLAESSENLE
jgi:hypothetical protein